MKERRSARYFLCFRPADADDGGGRMRFVGKTSYDDRGSQSARFGSGREGGLKCPGKRLSVDGDVECSRRSYSDRLTKSAPKDGGGAAFTHLSGYATGGDLSAGDPVSSDQEVHAVESGRRSKSRKAFARVVNAIAFTTAAARSRTGKSSQERKQRSSFASRARGEDKSYRPPRSSAPTLTSSVKPDDEYSRRPPKHDAQKVDSSVSLSRSSTSSSTSVAYSLDSALEEKGSTVCKYPVNSGTTTALCLLAFTLTITILWGRLCAIFWTSTWLYFVRRRQSESPQKTAYSPPESTVKLPEVETKEYKKRIIMEGLLGRNHIHCRA
ncbi:hypothetical protein H6P81_005709 [Aristolochia fimbriata]|uniref:Uncharacterized protein n=1 Tax=Aristolochia fimbriata TaxID=158543 RepID=A0AAV7EV72_ARIFI|nr:hypothetical protein H6P81_005709 [Aristolochia fimbriata]